MSSVVLSWVSVGVSVVKDGGESAATRWPAGHRGPRSRASQPAVSTLRSVVLRLTGLPLTEVSLDGT